VWKVVFHQKNGFRELSKGFLVKIPLSGLSDTPFLLVGGVSPTGERSFLGVGKVSEVPICFFVLSFLAEIFNFLDFAGDREDTTILQRPCPGKVESLVNDLKGALGQIETDGLLGNLK